MAEDSSIDESDNAADQRHKEIEGKHTKFYRYVGLTIIQWQSIEDFLPELFVAAVGIQEGRSRPLFDLIGGNFPHKTQAIEVALGTEELQKKWRLLKARINNSNQHRNEIAHGRPVQNTDPIKIIVKDGEAVAVIGGRNSWFELRKKTKKGNEVVLTIDDLKKRYNEMWDLFGELIAFRKEIQEKQAV